MTTWRLKVHSLESCPEAVGGKGQGLLLAAQRGARIPPTLVVPPSEYDSFTEKLGPRDRGFPGDVRDWQAMRDRYDVLDVDLPTEHSRGVTHGPWIARSSVAAPFRDAVRISGAFESFVANSPQDLGAAVLKVWSSPRTQKAVRQTVLFALEWPLRMAVLLQPFLAAETSGLLQTSRSSSRTSNVNRLNRVLWTDGHLGDIAGGNRSGVEVFISHSYVGDKRGLSVRGRPADVERSVIG